MKIERSRYVKILTNRINSEKSEFIAVYGRRRVGKTFLIRDFFKDKFTLHITGMANVGLYEQLTNFHLALSNQYPDIDRDMPESWFIALQQMRMIIEKSKHKRKVVFIDELPWFDSPKSGFIQALEHFWNGWAAHRKDMLLVVCGSATSWIINKLINNRGGLHNRLTQKIRVEPFSLKECELLMKSKKINLDRYQLIQLYMVLGGIPYYWQEIEKGKSAMQNIDNLCFNKNGLLVNEFANLFKSLFTKAERHEAIVAALAKKSMGLTREEIIKESKLSDGGGFTRLLTELEESGFIRKYTPFQKQYRKSLYQLSDFYSLFYQKFMKNKNVQNDSWLNKIDSPQYRTWSGYTFEQVCLSHMYEIKKALGISGVQTEISSWRSNNKENKSQIDLLIERKDGIINLCEIKFSISPYAINKKYDRELRNKITAFKTETKTNKSVFLTLITTFGLTKNAYYGTVQNELSMDILFE